MTHTYKITGMTCDSCQAKVQKLLSTVDGVTDVTVDWRKGEAKITMSKHIMTSVFQDALKPFPKYQLSDAQENIPHTMPVNLVSEPEKSWLETYKPVLLIFAFITGVSFLVQAGEDFSWIRWMNDFMAGFFLTFSFFKLLNLPGFADSYSTYDIIAKRWRAYGYVYAFIELGLGLAFLTGFQPLLSNTVALVVMSISLVGVLQSVLNKRKIRCACLGDVFNLPMSTITIIEDALMIIMSATMLIYMLK